MRISNFSQTIQTNSGDVTELLTLRSEIDSSNVVPSESQSRIFFSSTPIPEVPNERRLRHTSNVSIITLQIIYKIKTILYLHFTIHIALNI